ncbi:MAG: hypothetical protein CMI97_02750 [Pelagibacteraceae bacterium]|nr:hypothetical protein [Pelagibacteraceae bacterium]
MSKFKFLYLIFGIALLIFIFNKVDFNSFLNELNKLRFNFFAILIIYFIGFILDSYSWQLCIENLAKTKLKIYQVFKIRIIGEAFNYILFQVGGEPVKAFLLKNNFGIKYKLSIGSLILAKTIILFALIIFCFIGLISIFYTGKFGENFENAALVGFVLFTTLISLFFIVQRYKLTSKLHNIFKNKFSKKFNNVFKHLKDTENKISNFYKKTKADFFKILFLNLSNWFFGALELYAIFYLLDERITFLEAIAIETLVQLVRAMLFFIPSNIGTQEGVFVLAVNVLKDSTPLGLAVAIIRRLREVIWISIGLILGFNQKIDFKEIKKKL